MISSLSLSLLGMNLRCPVPSQAEAQWLPIAYLPVFPTRFESDASVMHLSGTANAIFTPIAAACPLILWRTSWMERKYVVFRTYIGILSFLLFYQL